MLAAAVAPDAFSLQKMPTGHCMCVVSVLPERSGAGGKEPCRQERESREPGYPVGVGAGAGNAPTSSSALFVVAAAIDSFYVMLRYDQTVSRRLTNGVDL